MPNPVSRDEVQALVADGGQLVEVLPRDEYDEEHLLGAVNIPLRELDAPGVAQLDRARPVIVYCFDFL